MSNDASVQEHTTERPGVGVLGGIVLALLTVVALAASVGMFAVGILRVLGYI